MKKQATYIGVDVSKSTLDICVLQQDRSAKHFEVGNSEQDIMDFFKAYQDKPVKVCCENTGKYSWLLLDLLSGIDIAVYQVNGLHLKRSMGLVRGKDDIIDAYRIALFISKNHGQMAPYQGMDRDLLKIKVLLSQRNLLVKQRAQHKTVIKENESLASLGIDGLETDSVAVIEFLTERVKQIERRIREMIGANQILRVQDGIMTSIPGVGPMVSWNILVKTNGFRRITKAKKFACYSGVAPFHVKSGSSIYTRPKVSHYADKSMKKLLHMSAVTAVHMENDLRDYYLRKLGEGKNKMLVLNAVRNKIIQRVFAMIKSGKKYQTNLELT